MYTYYTFLKVIAIFIGRHVKYKETYILETHVRSANGTVLGFAAMLYTKQSAKLQPSRHTTLKKTSCHMTSHRRLYDVISTSCGCWEWFSSTDSDVFSYNLVVSPQYRDKIFFRTQIWANKFHLNSVPADNVQTALIKPLVFVSASVFVTTWS